MVHDCWILARAMDEWLLVGILWIKLISTLMQLFEYFLSGCKEWIRGRWCWIEYMACSIFSAIGTR